jgi:hypothetical protein
MLARDESTGQKVGFFFIQMRRALSFIQQAVSVLQFAILASFNRNAGL